MPTEQLEVSQRARDFVSGFLRDVYGSPYSLWEPIKLGLNDDYEMLQMVARFEREILDTRAGEGVKVALDMLENIQMHATNHSGWVENNPMSGVSTIHDWATKGIVALSTPTASDTPSPSEGELAAAINQNDTMRQELAYVGDLTSQLARKMGVDQANDDGTWPDLAGRLQKLIASTTSPSDVIEKRGEGDAPAIVATADLSAWLAAIVSGDWTWTTNSPCKYVTLHIDTRRGAYRIEDRDGNVISFHALLRQGTGSLALASEKGQHNG